MGHLAIFIFISSFTYGVIACSSNDKGNAKGEPPPNNGKLGKTDPKKDKGKGNADATTEETNGKSDGVSSSANKAKLFDGKWVSNCTVLNKKFLKFHFNISGGKAVNTIEEYDEDCKTKAGSFTMEFKVIIGNKSSLVEGAYEVDLVSDDGTVYSLWKISEKNLFVGKDPGATPSKRSKELQKKNELYYTKAN